MADEKSEILITIDVNKEGAAKQVVSLKKELEQLAAVRKALKDNLKAGILTEQEYTESMVQAEKKAVTLRAELTKQQATLKQTAAIQAAAKGSLEQMRAQMNQTAVQVAALSGAERDYSKEGRALVDSLRDQIAALKTVEKGYGDNRREVGNYALATQTAAKQVTTLTTANKSAADSLQDVEGQLGGLGGALGNVREKLAGAKAGLQGMKLGLTGIKGAIAATGIGVLLLFLGGLYTLLTKTQGGMDKLAQATAAVGAVVSVLIDRGIKLGKAFAEAFTKPQAALASFREALTGIPAQMAAAATAAIDVEKASQRLREAERNLNVERARSRAQIEGLKKTAEDVSKSEKERLAAARSASGIEQGLLAKQISVQKQRINNLKQEVALGQDTAEARDRIADAEVQLAEYQEDSLGKQTELQNKVNEIRISSTQARAAKEIATQQEVLDVFMAQSEHLYDTEVDRADKLLEIKKAILDAQLAYDLAATVAGSDQALAVQAKYNADLATLNYESLAEQNANESAIKLDGIAARASIEREGSVERLKINQEELDEKLFADQLEARRTVKSKEALDARLLALEKEYQANSNALKQRSRDEEFRIQGELLEAGLARAETGSAREYQIRLKQIKLRARAAIENQELAEEEIYKIVAQSQRAEDDLRKERFQAVAGRITEMASQASDFASRLVEADIQRQATALEAAQQAALDNNLLTTEQRTAIEKDFQQKKIALELEAAKRRKKIATVENVINTARAITAAYTTPVIGPVLAAIAAAVGLAQQIAIESQQFARGGVPVQARRRYEGVINGPGTTTSDSIPANLSRDESVINARSTAKHYDLLSAINQDGGGVAFPGTGTSGLMTSLQTYVADLRAQGRDYAQTYTGPAYIPSTSLTNTATGNGIDHELLSTLIGDRVSQAVANLPASVVYVDHINRAQQGVRVVQQNANI